MLDLDGLAAFRAVARASSFSAAARTLYVSQPVVSKRVARLERAIGLDLLDRSSRQLRLTPAGSRLLEEAEALLAGHARMLAVAATLRDGHR